MPNKIIQVSLCEKEEERLHEFINEHDSSHGKSRAAIGGRYSYVLTPTSLGTGIVVICNACKVEKDITSYEDW